LLLHGIAFIHRTMVARLLGFRLSTGASAIRSSKRNPEFERVTTYPEATLRSARKVALSLTSPAGRARQKRITETPRFVRRSHQINL
jgi:hypothetical protein